MAFLYPHFLGAASDFLERFLHSNDQAHGSIGDDDGEEVDWLGEVPPLEPDGDPVEFEPLAVVGKAPLAPGITTVGAWCGSSSLRNPRRDVAFAVSVGINQLHIIVNDHSKWRKEQPFTIRERARLIRLADECHKHGIEVCLMSWIMPHESYIREAAKVLIPLMRDMGATRLVWDAEEPYTLAKRGMGWKQAGALVGELFAGITMGITGIRYASKRKLAPLAEHCDQKIVQAYATSSSKAPPTTVASKGHRQWSAMFGAYGIVIALAAYRQTGIRLPRALAKLLGRTFYKPAEAIAAAVADAAKHGNTVILWGINSIRKSPEVALAVAAIRGRPESETRNA